ncbi:MAG: ribokinase [Chloroflexi bacterium]|nr:MAG: ribokinase [Chloroflexota bacterium]PIE80086.1 MAG: ribokinase [Chloroflexota bacterium]
MNIVITGSIAFDYLMHFPGKFSDAFMADQLDKISLSFLVDSMKKHPGGTAPNIAYTLALLGSSPKVMATAGQDFKEYRASLEAVGVDTAAIVAIEDDFTASFFVSTDDDQNQIATFYTGAMAYAKELTFAHYAPDAELAIISPNDPDAMHNHAEECRQLGIPFIYDPSQQTARLKGEDLAASLKGAYMLTVNDYEYNLIKEKTGLSDNDIRDQVSGLLITKGKEGALLWMNGEDYHIPVVPPQTVKEPTGVGDAFRAGMMRGMELELPQPVIGRMGALAATYVLEHVGTQNHAFTPQEFVARYREHFDDEGALDILK